MMNVIQTVLAAQLVAKGDLAGLGEIVGPRGAMARRVRLLRRSCPPARDGQQAIERLGCVFEQRHSREPGGAA
jgi:hypothetical protein